MKDDPVITADDGSEIGAGDIVTIEYAGRGFVTGKVKSTSPDGDLIVQEGYYRPRFFRRHQIVRLTLRDRASGGRLVPIHGSGP